MLRQLLAHPLTRDLSIDSPEPRNYAARLFARSRFSARSIPTGVTLSRNKYRMGLVKCLNSVRRGYPLRSHPRLITSEVFPCTGIKMVADGRSSPAGVFESPRHRHDRCAASHSRSPRLLPRGATLPSTRRNHFMIEPWVSSWSKLIYNNLHHEPFETAAENWSFPQQGPLSGANEHFRGSSSSGTAPNSKTSSPISASSAFNRSCLSAIWSGRRRDARSDAGGLHSDVACFRKLTRSLDAALGDVRADSGAAGLISEARLRNGQAEAPAPQSPAEVS